MIKAVVLALVLTVQLVQSTSFEQTRDCLHGPEFWCKSVQNARRCGAFKHCLDTVWTTHHRYLKVDQADKSCDSCIECLHGDTQMCPNVDLNLNEIADLYMASIPSMTICKLVDGCKKVEIAEEKTENLVNLDDCRNLHPRTWCDSIENARMCNSLDYCRENIWSKLKPMVLADDYQKSDGECGFCIWTFNKLHEILQQNLTEFSIEQYLLGACTLFPSKDDESRCTDAIKKNFDEVYNLIRNSMDPGIICRVIKLCKDEHLTEKKPFKISIKILNPDEAIVTSSLNEQPHSLGSKSEILVPKLAKTSGVACELCSLVLNGAKYLIQNENDEKMVLDFITKSLCGRMGSLNATCVEYIDTEGKNIIDALVKNVDASLICHKMGLCLSQQVTSPNTKRFFDINVKNGQNCTLCKLVLTEVKTMLQNKNSEGQILDYIRKNLCEKSTQYSEMCKTVVTAYGPLLLEFISNDINPTQICQLIGLCSKSTEEIDNSPKCVICELVITELSKYVTQNSSQAEVQKWLEYVCNGALPSHARQECTTFVNEYGPMIIQLILTQVQPRKICSILKVCTSSVEKPIAPVKPVVADSSKVYCEACELTLQFIAYELNKDKSKESVKNTLESVCKIAPRSMRDSCNSIVETYGVYLIDLLEKYAEPLAICYRIKLCPHKVNEIDIVPVPKIPDAAVDMPFVSQQTKNDRLKLPIQPEVKDTKCQLCLYVAEIIDGLLKQNKTDEEIKEALEKVCNYFPGSLKDQCKSFMDAYLVYVLELLADDLDPQQTCQELKLCAANSEISHVDFRTLLKSLRDNVMHKVNAVAPVENKQTKNDLLKLPEPEIKVKDTKCQLCIYVAETAQGLLKQNKTEEEIKQELEKVCSYFPGSLKDQCTSFMDSYLVYVLELLAADLDPQQACQKLNLCSATNQISHVDFRALLKTFRDRVMHRFN